MKLNTFQTVVLITGVSALVVIFTVAVAAGFRTSTAVTATNVEKPAGVFQQGDRVRVVSGQWGNPHIAEGVVLHIDLGRTTATVLFISNHGDAVKLEVPISVLTRP